MKVERGTVPFDRPPAWVSFLHARRDAIAMLEEFARQRGWPAGWTMREWVTIEDHRKVIISTHSPDGREVRIGYGWTDVEGRRAAIEMAYSIAIKRREYHDWSN